MKINFFHFLILFILFLKFKKSNLILNLYYFSIEGSIDCMDFLHEKGIIHGNICCSNLLRKENDGLKICDFKYSQRKDNTRQIDESEVKSIKWSSPQGKF